jgi:hypothetical protein
VLEPLPRDPRVSSLGHAASAAFSVAREVDAVVVTVSVEPLTVHVPPGIVQLAVYVGGVLNPLALSANVNALPAAPLCDGFGTTTAGAPANVAVTEVFAEMLNVHVVLVLPAHAPPLQLVNVAPALGTAVNVIAVPDANEVPVGDCVTVPGPFTAVVSVNCGGPANVAVTVVFSEILNVHAMLVTPAHAPPDQPVNVAPEFGMAIRLIAVPHANEFPVGVCETVPGPLIIVVNVYFCVVEKVPDTWIFPVIVKTHTGFVLPPHAAPTQLVNVAPASGTAVAVITVPDAKVVPGGDNVTVPGPLVLNDTVY